MPAANNAEAAKAAAPKNQTLQPSQTSWHAVTVQLGDHADLLIT
jgi:hypothetical protein